MTQIFFTITQKDPSVLYHIQNQFNFGIIKANCGPKKKYFYYLIYDYKGLTCLISLFNGNIILDKVYKHFDAFLKGYYDCFKTRTDLPVFIFNSNQPTIKLDNADSLSLVDMTYILSQKGRYQGFYQLQCSSKSYILVIIDYFNYNM